MKSLKLPLLLLVLLFVVVFMARYRLPEAYDWSTSFEHRDYNPFGCALFDSVMSASLPQGYVVTNKSFIALERDSSLAVPVTVLLIDSYKYMESTEVDMLLSFVERGNNVVLCVESFPNDLMKKIDVKEYDLQLSRLFTVGGSFPEMLGDEQRECTLQWRDSAGGYARAGYNVNCILVDQALQNDRSRIGATDTLVTLWVEYEGKPLHSDLPVALACNIGKGRLVLCTFPRLMTNYGILCANSGTLVMRLLSSCPSRGPVIRLDNSMNGLGRNAQSPYRFILENTPLRWAFYLLLMVCAVAFFFTARRRQRVIPVVEPPVNRSLQMVEHIGTLYYEHGDHLDLLTKKVAYFADVLRRETLLDWDDDIETLAYGIARVTRLEAGDVRDRVTFVKSLLEAEQPISSSQLMRALDHINVLLDEIEQNF